MSDFFSTYQIYSNSSNNGMFCCYCKRIINEKNRHVADDHQLHPETRNKECCDKCYKLITLTDRQLNNYIHAKTDADKMRYLYNAIANLQEIAEDTDIHA